MNTDTVNIACRKDLLKQIDQLAKKESQGRCQLIRKAPWMYIEKKKNGNHLQLWFRISKEKRIVRIRSME